MKKPILYFVILVMMSCTSKNQNDNEKDQALTDTTQQQQDTLLNALDNSQDLDSADLKFLQQAAYGGMIEVESSNKILTVTEDASVKSFAEMMVKDHSAANQRLETLASTKGYRLPTLLPYSKTELINKMDTYKNEGRNEYYLRLMLNEHMSAIDLFSLASRSEDKEIRAFASSILPTLETHYQHVKKADSLFRQPKQNQGDDPLKISDRTKKQ